MTKAEQSDTDRMNAGFGAALEITEGIVDGMNEQAPIGFIYKLNAMEHASQADHPNKMGYSAKRTAVLDHVAALQAQIAALERGEFICKDCGLRKDSEHEKGDF